MCLGINIHRCNEDIVYDKKVQKRKDLPDVTNEAMAEIIFSNILEYGYMHSSQIIHEAVLDAV